MKEQIYTGTAKNLYSSDRDYSLLMSFKDYLRKNNNEIIEISGKGTINNHISAYIMEKLDMIGIENHFMKKNNMREQLIQCTDVYPIQVNICTIACGRYIKDFGLEEGLVFDQPMIDFRVKNKRLSYPAINEQQIINFNWMNKKELAEIKQKSLRIHDFLSGLFATANIRLVDIKLEFGRVFDGDDFDIMLIDEISPDTCRLWDMQDNEKLCYEIAENSPENLLTAYQKVLTRLNIDLDSHI